MEKLWGDAAAAEQVFSEELPRSMVITFREDAKHGLLYSRGPRREPRHADAHFN